jgi:hypothetical protein
MVDIKAVLNHVRGMFDHDDASWLILDSISNVELHKFNEAINAILPRHHSHHHHHHNHQQQHQQQQSSSKSDQGVNGEAGRRAL